MIENLIQANGTGAWSPEHNSNGDDQSAADPMAGGTGGSKRSEEVPEAGAYRRNGNVARLPKAVRNRINEMIQDGMSYREIIERLGEEGKGLDISNLSRWKDGGYQDWLAEQAFIARTRARQEMPGELVKNFDATEVNHAALQLGTLHVFEALRELGPGSLDKKLGGDCAAFARLLNALARASREAMQLQKYREACAQARAALQGLKDVRRKLTESETRAIVRQVDSILGLSSEDEEEGWEGPKGEIRGPNTWRCATGRIPNAEKGTTEQLDHGTAGQLDEGTAELPDNGATGLQAENL